jgi:hypothetical protein
MGGRGYIDRWTDTEGYIERQTDIDGYIYREQGDLKCLLLIF